MPTATRTKTVKLTTVIPAKANDPRTCNMVSFQRASEKIAGFSRTRCTQRAAFATVDSPSALPSSIELGLVSVTNKCINSLYLFWTARSDGMKIQIARFSSNDVGQVGCLR